MTYKVKSVNILGSDMDCLVFTPESAGPFPGVVVAQHIPNAHDGLEADPFTIDIGNKFVAKGYACVIPFIFHWWPAGTDLATKRAEWDDAKTLADLDAACDLLQSIDGIDPDRIAILGHCWGGRMAWLGACHNSQYKVLGTLYGGRIKVGMGKGNPPPIDLVNQMNCAVIGIFGKDDGNPSPEDVVDLEAALVGAGTNYEFHSYEGAGHGFQDFVSEDRYHPEATKDSWTKICDFFDARLQSRSP